MDMCIDVGMDLLWTHGVNMYERVYGPHLRHVPCHVYGDLSRYRNGHVYGHVYGHVPGHVPGQVNDLRKCFDVCMLASKEQVQGHMYRHTYRHAYGHAYGHAYTQAHGARHTVETGLVSRTYVKDLNKSLI